VTIVSVSYIYSLLTNSIVNKQSQIVSISQSTKADTITFNQLDDYVYYLAVVDPEGTAATFNVEYEVLHDSNPITNKKPFSLQPVTGKAPYNYKIVFTPADFDEQEIESGLYTYEIELTVSDDDSILNDNIYTITVNIDNINHKPYYSGTAEETVLQGWTVGSQSDPLPAIAISLFDDRDELDTIVFDATRLCEF